MSGHSRGFGFIEYDDPMSLVAVMQNGNRHPLKGKTCEVKPAMPRGEAPPGAFSCLVFVTSVANLDGRGIDVRARTAGKGKGKDKGTGIGMGGGYQGYGGKGYGGGGGGGGYDGGKGKGYGGGGGYGGYDGGKGGGKG